MNRTVDIACRKLRIDARRVECAGTDVQLEQAVFKQLEIALRGQAAFPGGDVDGVEHQFPLFVCGVACDGEAAVRACRAGAELPRDFGRGGRAADADAAVQPAFERGLQHVFRADGVDAYI
ncbi:Uncharacterised protein [Neisseria gonorrhoeae]|uniref:Uncharacterized protein n=1 Tax=Neisseria gonorrhoeae TaxID=485 RepID=A0A378W1G3_NEIGO|nr:Uncharacterised protein [Neisseria gonorrhoeae]